MEENSALLCLRMQKDVSNEMGLTFYLFNGEKIRFPRGDLCFFSLSVCLVANRDLTVHFGEARKKQK